MLDQQQSVSERIRFYREDEKAWVFRVLGVPPESYGIEITSTNEVLLKLNMSATSVEALRAWSMAKKPGVREDMTNCVVLVPYHAASGSFLLTRKDMRHPKPECRLKLSLLAGSMNTSGETPRQAMLRELYEEVRSVEVADYLASLMQAAPAPLRLKGVQMPGEFNCHVFTAQAAIRDDLDVWVETLHDPQIGLSEAKSVVLKREELSRLIAEEDQQPGRHFLSSLHEVLRPLVGNA
ncbi:MAG: NUDIX domain-containing protein [Patescibacteria group bacterium]